MLSMLEYTDIATETVVHVNGMKKSVKFSG